MEILNTISSEKLPEWAADILFPPLRSILVLPGEEGKIVEAGVLGRSIRRQLHADHLDCVGDCSENESINTRSQAAQALARYFETTARHTGGGYDAWTVKDPEGKEWKLMSDGSIEEECKTASGYRRINDPDRMSGPK